jgi:DNA-binding GntR family transcriptional regulator
VESARNKTLERHLRALYAQVQALRLRTLYLPVRLRASFKEHQRLYDALRQRDAAAAEQAAREHIETTMNDALAILAQTASKAGRA